MRAALIGALVALALVALWAWIGREQAMPPSPLSPGERVACVSYAPFERGQSPFTPGIVIPAAQIERQLAALAAVTDCVRTYSTGEGLDQVPALAEKQGLRVLLGIWLGRDRAANEREIATAIALAQSHPATVRAVIVGNEVLLRGELPAGELAAIIRRVKAAVPVPVTYADVWEFWEKYPELAPAVDFATIHILPYWEDEPVAIDAAAAHVAAIYRHMEQALPGKPLLIGETGWPSAGHQRAGAVPSPANQARFFHELLALLQAAGWDYNLIEAFDQGWKRQLEGTVGGHWGFLDGAARPKFVWGRPVSDHPDWPWQAAAGVVLTLLTLTAGALARGAALLRVGLLALVAGLAVPWWVEQALDASQDLADGLRALLALLLGLLLPPLAATALSHQGRRPVLAALLGQGRHRLGFAERWLGWGLALSLLLVLPWVLALVVDPRYRDFDNAALAVPAATFLLLRAGPGPRLAEQAMAALLLPGSLAILAAQGPENLQALLYAVLVLALGLGLRPWPGRAAAVPAPAPAA
jgi:glucan 1,3-beta-glucosidase